MSMCLWVRAMFTYAQVLKIVEPKREVLAAAQREGSTSAQDPGAQAGDTGRGTGVDRAVQMYAGGRRRPRGLRCWPLGCGQDP
eukprot:363733-Chlamydomonas_euryale.AAC.1